MDEVESYCCSFTDVIAACDVCSKKPVIAMFPGCEFGEQPCENCLRKLGRGDPDLIQNPEQYWAGLEKVLREAPTVEDDPNFEDPEPFL